MTNYPTARQRKILWTAITVVAVTTVGAIALYLIVLLGRTVAFLQPVLIPFAVAAVLAFLLEPIVRVLTTRTRLPRTAAVVVVFAFIGLTGALLLVSVVPQIYRQTAYLVQSLPAYTQKAQTRLLTLLEASQKKLDQLDHLFPATPKPSPAPDPGASPAVSSASPADASPTASVSPAPAALPGESPTTTPDGNPAASASPEASPTESPASSPATGESPTLPPPVTDRPLDTSAIHDYIQRQLPALGKQAPAMIQSAWFMAYRSVGGVLGGLGILLNAIIIPVYLFFLLVESRNIARRWSEYLPMQDSPLKQEIVSVLMEINGYLVAFFRGQLIVSTIDGILIGSSLYFFVHLDFSFFIALLVIVLTFIPYLGIVLCYIPAVLIALIQYGDWQHPLLVVAIMFAIQNLEGFILAPKIVGDSVGLHPLTVIISIFGWSLLLEGPIGAILAVPLTASIKVLLRRYVWQRRERQLETRSVPLAVAAAGGGMKKDDASPKPGPQPIPLPALETTASASNPARPATPLPRFPVSPPPTAEKDPATP